MTIIADKAMDQGTPTDKILKQQIQTLRSGNRAAILTTLKELRGGGKSEVLPELFEILAASDDPQVRSEILSLLNDLKNQETVPYLVDAIRNPDYSGIVGELVAACWQNGLSYGAYLDTFLEVALHGEYAALIEAFTVMEEAIGDVEQQEREKLANKLQSRLKEAEEQKHPLLKELIRVINRY